ncbi:hypothetical protein ACLFMI_14570 [Pseudonocardia nantongensis]
MLSHLHGDHFEAFAFLSDGSQRLNRKIRDLADAIVAAGDLPRPAAH